MPGRFSSDDFDVGRGHRSRVARAVTPPDEAVQAIAAYGLLRLAQLDAAATYAQAAHRTLRTLSEAFLAPPHQPAILLHVTADLPHGLGIDASTIYGDYFFVRALQVLRGTASRTGGCL